MAPERKSAVPIHRIEIGSADSGRPLLLLHGFTGSARGWGVSFLAELATGRVVLAVDLPGHGESPASAEPEGNRIEAVVETLVKILDERDIEMADWAGYSMGGRVALAAAVTQPDRVGRLVLESASPGIELESDRAARQKEDEALAARIERLGMGWFVDEWMARPIFESQRRLSMKAVEEARGLRLRNRPEGLAAALRGYGLGVQPSYWDALVTLPHSTLLLTGGLDLKFEAIGARISRLLPRGTHVSVPNAGHAVHVEEPQRWLAEVSAFLSRPDENDG
jgi:2-succinyl-6-hydroxy-2,4-cyclohexadiene-1-carboxylate synthase